MILITEQPVNKDMDNEEDLHVPVMLRESMESLSLQSGNCAVDCTLGLAGHSLKIAEKISPTGHLIAIDRDGDSIKQARERLKNFSIQMDFRQDDFRHIDKVLSDLNISEVDGILYDLGISSFQLNDRERGFSLKSEGPLDMRMDRESYISAYDLVNSLSEREISSILKNFGQERFHNRIARFLVQQRLKAPLETTKDLTEVVLRAVPRKFQNQRIHPATRTFQAIRIAVNRELEALEIALEKSINFLKIGGRICVISFHSLEDKIVKEKFRSFAKAGRIKIIFKKPLRPTEDEIHNNSRCRSARLRVAERTT